MKSCLYECHVLHARFSPRQHQFRYRIFLFAIDLEELDALPGRLALFSVGRPNVYSFRERDHLPSAEPVFNLPADTATAPAPAGLPLKERVLGYLRQREIDATGGRIVLVTLPRIFGYGFNPVSFYFCFDRAGQPVAAIAEVTNTFREIKPYFLAPDPQSAARGEFRLRVPKFFYVSPYSDVDTAFDFTLRLPGERLSIQIDDYIGEERVLTSTLAGPRRDLTNARLAWYTLKYPLLTLQITAGIHWHALRLWLKRVPWFPKAARAVDQKLLYRPHSSLAPAAPARRAPTPNPILPASDPV